MVDLQACRNGNSAAIFTPQRRPCGRFGTSGIYCPVAGAFGDFEAGCDATVSAQSAVLSACICSSTGMNSKGPWHFRRATGAGPFRYIGNKPVFAPAISFSAFRLAAGRDGQWNRDPFDLKESGSADLDLRISAAHMLFSHFELEDAAFSVMRNSGRLELALAGAKAYQGAIKGRVTFDLGATGVGMQATGTVLGADFAALSFDAFGWPEFYGSLTGTANLESVRCQHVRTHAQPRWDGANRRRARTTRGDRLDPALHRIDKSPLAFSPTFIGDGPLSITPASICASLRASPASRRQARKPSLRVGFGGTVDFGERGLDLHAVAKSAAGRGCAGQGSPEFSVRYRRFMGRSGVYAGRARSDPPVRRGGAAVSAKARCGQACRPRWGR